MHKSQKTSRYNTVMNFRKKQLKTSMFYLYMCAVHVPCGIPEQPEHYIALWIKAINNRKCCLQDRKNTVG